ncbi:hypothetical protein ACQ4M4_28135 [Leptolyngbya sp. AN02str]|uniref:hypothetical protein n=1 Tax=Leptolyngbya sp. AN02str TaxID=3423363 RepID=UPI003D316DA3
MTNAEPPDEMGLVGYRPTWVEYEAASDHLCAHLRPMMASPLCDIWGVVSEEGWEPDWPLILWFEAGAVSFSTKCSERWAIEPWNAATHFDPTILNESTFQILELESLVTGRSPQPAFAPLIGQALTTVHWPTHRSYGVLQSFFLWFETVGLHIFDGGDEIACAIVSGEEWLTLIAHTECLLA